MCAYSDNSDLVDGPRLASNVAALTTRSTAREVAGSLFSAPLCLRSIRGREARPARPFRAL